MSRHLTPDEKIKLSTEVKDWQLKFPQGTAKQCAFALNESGFLQGYKIKEYTIYPYWEGSKNQVPVNRGSKKKLVQPVETSAVSDVPTVSRLIEKIQGVLEFAKQVKELQHKGIEKLLRDIQ